MTQWKKIIAALIILAVLGGAWGWYWYHKKPPDIRQAAAVLEVTATDLLEDFESNEEAAVKKYVDKVIVVSGTISEIKAEANATTVFLDGGDPLATVNCSFYESEANQLTGLRQGMNIKIKGVCTGRLMDVVLNKCSLVQ